MDTETALRLFALFGWASMAMFAGGLYFRLRCWLYDRRRAAYPRARRRDKPLEISFDGWIQYETDQTFGEWLEATKRGETDETVGQLYARLSSRPETFGIPRGPAPSADTGTLRASLPPGTRSWIIRTKPPTGNTGTR